MYKSQKHNFDTFLNFLILKYTIETNRKAIFWGRGTKLEIIIFFCFWELALSLGFYSHFQTLKKSLSRN